MSTKHIAAVVIRAELLCLLLWLPGLTTVTRAADSGTSVGGDATQATPASAGSDRHATQTAPTAATTGTATDTSAQTPAATPAATPATTTATATAMRATGAAHGSGGARPGEGAPTASTAPASGTDSIQLGTTEISGNRELPKLLYIVPWQRAQIGKFAGRPPNSLVDEALTPVDRAVFERQNRYYAALESSTESARSQGGTAPTPSAGGSPRDEK